MDRPAYEKKTNIVSRLTALYLGALLIGEPLIVHNGFFDITEVKTAFFVVCTVIYLTGRGVCALQFGGRGASAQIDDLMALGLCATALFASAASGYFRVSFFGSTGRWQGALMLWGYAAVYMALRGVPLRERDVELPLCIGLALSALGCCLDHLGLDVFGFAAALGPFDAGRYISTLGNVNFAGAYLSLTLPVALRQLLCAKERRRRLVLGIVCVLGLWGSMAVRSECALLGAAAGIALLPFTLRDRPDALRRWCLLLPAAVLTAELFRLLAAGCGVGLSALTAALLRPVPAAAVSLAGAAAWLLCCWCHDTRRILKVYAALLAALILCAVSAVVLLNTIYYYVNLNGWEDWLRFSDGWGTDRLGVWKYCLAIYREFPPLEKLIGGGCGVLARIDAQHRYFTDAVLDAAHCEYLQILLNWGALGLLFYLGWLGSAFARAFRRGGELTLALLPGLAAYALQAAVNIAQAPGIVLFFPLLAALRAEPSSKVQELEQKER